MASLKERKELFVSDLLGGSISEIYGVTCISLTAYLTLSLVLKYFKRVHVTIDYLLNAVTLLLAITLYTDRLRLLHLLIPIPAILFALAAHEEPKSKSKSKSTSTSTKKEPAKKEKDVGLLVKKPFLTTYRSHMIIMTNLCILAVDFNVFPRRFAKVETWGTSLMDLGVGSFVFSMGLVNSRSIIKQKINSKISSFLVKRYLQLIGQNVIKSLPILVLGLVRMVSVKSLEYQEHVTEYGIHWNFFFTLGFLPVVIGILDPFLNLFPRALVAIIIGLSYEFALNQLDLLKFILRTDNRMESIITQNKEGIFSFFGYLSIFIFGQSFGSFVLTNVETPNNLLWINTTKTAKKTKNNWLTVSTTGGLIITTVTYQLLFLYCKESTLFNNVSRRVANFPYVLWVVLYNAALLLGYDLIQQFFKFNFTESSGSTGSALLEATNNNGLFCFLLGNLLTGLINMSIDTLKCSNAVAFGILFIYGAILSVIVIKLDERKIYIKL